MAKPSRLKWTLSIVVCGVLIVAGVKYLGKAFVPSHTTSAVMRAKGNPGAPIRVTEFIDLECPACAQGAKYLAQFMANHPGSVRLELKYFPLKMHRHGLEVARYAECAAREGKFWPYHDLLLERQANWSRLMDATPAFILIAGEVGLDPQRLNICLKDGSVDALIAQNQMEGEKRGVKSTPTYYVNGKMVVGINSLQSELTQLLNASQK
ncbi:MAG: thioredoxin domain-containing protein [Candidatus Omnitrophica bacterium]|nr:thioredoxin domain-containing protein [Candidatus Omnitrophota bacterium]